MSSAWHETALKDMLPVFYRHLFPYAPMLAWLSYGSPAYLARREFSYTLPGGIYARYQCVADEAQWRAELAKKAPEKIDIGAVYNVSPAHHSRVERFEAQEKELVFDIDASDYADVLVQAEAGPSLTSALTWPWMAAVCAILQHSLSEDFGFQHILFVYSGRRGVHCWVCDERARRLSNQARTAIAEFLQVLVDGTPPPHTLKDEHSLHPTLSWAYQRVLLPLFETHIVPSLWEPLNRLLTKWAPDDVKAAVLLKWRNDKADGDQGALSERRWREYRATVEEWLKKQRTPKSNPLVEVVVAYTYPRLDIHVSTQVNHLLKAPFVVHPGTGRVCVPFLAEHAAAFRPEDVPTIQQLLAEFDEHGGDASHTSLQPYIEQFKDVFLRPLQASRLKTEASEDPMDIEDLA